MASLIAFPRLSASLSRRSCLKRACSGRYRTSLAGSPPCLSRLRVALFLSPASTAVKRLSANLRKIRPRTGIAYSADLEVRVGPKLVGRFPQPSREVLDVGCSGLCGDEVRYMIRRAPGRRPTRATRPSPKPDEFGGASRAAARPSTEPCSAKTVPSSLTPSCVGRHCHVGRSAPRRLRRSQCGFKECGGQFGAQDTRRPAPGAGILRIGVDIDSRR
jgi:hypothetical protein